MMSKISVYKGDEKIAVFYEVNGLIVKRDRILEICNGITWITFQPEDYDWFVVI